MRHEISDFFGGENASEGGHQFGMRERCSNHLILTPFKGVINIGKHP